MGRSSQHRPCRLPKRHPVRRHPRLAGQLRRRVALAQGTAERVRDGDLSTAVRDDGRDEFSPLLAALDEMQSSLSRVVADVRGSAESVGQLTTKSVVESIFCVIVLDAIFSVIFLLAGV